MGDAELRSMLVEVLETSSIVVALESGWSDAFVAGRLDVAFSQMELDSLGMLELCMAVEWKTGVTIRSREFARIGSLAGLAERIEQEQ